MSCTSRAEISGFCTFSLAVMWLVRLWRARPEGWDSPAAPMVPNTALGSGFGKEPSKATLGRAPLTVPRQQPGFKPGRGVQLLGHGSSSGKCLQPPRYLELLPGRCRAPGAPALLAEKEESCSSCGRLQGAQQGAHRPSLQSTPCPGCPHSLGRCRAARGALVTPCWALRNSYMREKALSSPARLQNASRCFLCTVTQAGSAGPRSGRAGCAGALLSPTLGGTEGRSGRGAAPGLQRHSSGSVVPVLASGNHCFSQVLRGSAADLSPLSWGERGDACPCVLGCCCSWGVHSSFPSFLDNPDRHSMLHPYYKLLHEIMVFMTEH